MEMEGEPMGEMSNEKFHDLVGSCLSQLGCSADGSSQVLLNLSLAGRGLVEIHPLCSYVHLQIIDVSRNQLSDLSPLSATKHLISLNASHNRLEKLLDFKAPFALWEANFSYNRITEIPDLSSYHCLAVLRVDCNEISEIKGLRECRRLKTLSLSANKIARISGLENIPLQHLDLSCNLIKKIENINSTATLLTFNLSRNLVRSLKGLQDLESLMEIDLEGNEIIDVSEVRYIRDLWTLMKLNLKGNPIQASLDYRLAMLFRMPALVELDRVPARPEEKVAATNLFSPSKELVATRDHMYNLVASYKQPVTLLESTLTTTQPYPMLAITGPCGMGKRKLARKLCSEFPEYFQMCLNHTTREPRIDLQTNLFAEKDGVDYIFVDTTTFEQEREQGIFWATCFLYGSWFGLSRESVESAARKRLACVVVMELEAIMAMRNTHFEPRYVLLLPDSKQVYEESLRQSGFYNESQICQAVSRVAEYEEMNRARPGYFDAVLMSDDFNELYSQLKETVVDYLGVAPLGSLSSGSSMFGKVSNPGLGKMKDSSGTMRSSRDPDLSSGLGSRQFESGFPLKLAKVTSVSSAREGTLCSPAALASYERRYEETRSALTGMRSSSELRLGLLQQSTTGIPHTRGYQNLLLGAVEEAYSQADTSSFSSACVPADESDDRRCMSGSSESSPCYTKSGSWSSRLYVCDSPESSHATSL